MDRRDALKSLVAIPGLTVTPVTVKEADEAALIVLKTPDHMTQEGAARLKTYWDHAVEGTPLQGVRTVVVHGDVDIEVIRKRVPIDG